jgi:hypothetical protein
MRSNTEIYRITKNMNNQLNQSVAQSKYPKAVEHYKKKNILRLPKLQRRAKDTFHGGYGRLLSIPKSNFGIGIIANEVSNGFFTLSANALHAASDQELIFSCLRVGCERRTTPHKDSSLDKRLIVFQVSGASVDTIFKIFGICGSLNKPVVELRGCHFLFSGC